MPQSSHIIILLVLERGSVCSARSRALGSYQQVYLMGRRPPRESHGSSHTTPTVIIHNTQTIRHYYQGASEHGVRGGGCCSSWVYFMVDCVKVSPNLELAVVVLLALPPKQGRCTPPATALEILYHRRPLEGIDRPYSKPQPRLRHRERPPYRHPTNP